MVLHASLEHLHGVAHTPHLPATSISALHHAGVHAAHPLHATHLRVHPSHTAAVPAHALATHAYKQQAAKQFRTQSNWDDTRQCSNK
jgi:hypothetical protein